MMFLNIMTLLFGWSTFALGILNSQNVDQLLTQSGIQKAKFNLEEATRGQVLVTNLDDAARNLIILLRRGFVRYSDRKWQHLYRNNMKRGKIQRPRFNEDFPCPLNGSRSKEIPTSVNQLRPGDIDVIASIGDSLSAGNGMFSKTFINLVAEFRGMAFSGGGMADWRTTLTLPNIVKVFNPKLYGFATNNVLAVDQEAHFNIAEPMIMSRDLVYQVRVLIERLRQDRHVDMAKHWKLLTIFVGNLDVCFDLCQSSNLWPILRQHEIDLLDAFTLLRDNIPRLVVNLMPAPNMVTTLGQMRNVPWSCHLVHSFGCRCVFSESYNDTNLRTASEYFTRWQAIDEYVANLPAFHTDDFAILYQPFAANAILPRMPNGDMDLRFFSSDCFHFSQLGHAAVANALWNNMLQSPGHKESVVREPFEWFECPTEQRPYIATMKNSPKP
ncbi:phospholipase B1, membrane-associated-like [Haematobia irritans]|uniref:phospholipase B1, membrane-associated-like n=1 Tax=Haematobia irritans TaxID=7368 RepID=UPI003F50853E